MNNQHPPPPRRVVNNSSLLLTPQENDCLQNYLGRKCITLSTAVVQVYTADRNSVWSKKCCGVACLVKDNPQRSYFIRVYDIKDGKILWEQELYNNFSYNHTRSYFHTFAGDTCSTGLNFASEEEAKRFRAAIGELLGRRQRRTEKRRDPPNGPVLSMATVDIKNPEINNMRFNNSQVNNIMPIHIKDKKKAKEAQLKDKETSKAIYEFIEKKGGVEAVKNELRRQDQIREGAQLKKVEQSNRPVSSTGRDALLDQIRQGKQLKTVSDGPESAPSTPGPTAGIVGALMEVMQKRSKAIHSSDEDEDEDDEEDFEDDDEWDD
ncbi:Neural Wiskott-Aldrich syndrome protein [Acipenser ruthenus]|uniref:Neural Wiskott-Aldrich syndrome protein n=1 Tax=Acipenser ruthenus TaxID=7906 RepID=A0A662YY89_ACIRT|nr:Neural Wiskott-Aldrich syndrome protein [Acipenser ruthenus]